METIDAIISALNKEMSLPRAYGNWSEAWIQYITLFTVIIISFYTIKVFRKTTANKLRVFILMISLMFMVSELYKQLLLSYQVGWRYPWSAFPFQFCSTPMYVMLIAGLLKPGKIQNALYGFLSTYALLAGLTVLLLPGTVLTTNLGLNIHTLVHHGGMVVVGITLLSRDPYIIKKSFLGASGVFVTLVILATILNFGHNIFIGTGTFNMFFINPKYQMPDQWMVLIQENTSHPVFLGVYVFGFTLAAYCVLEIGISVYKRNYDWLEKKHSDIQ